VANGPNYTAFRLGEAKALFPDNGVWTWRNKELVTYLLNVLVVHHGPDN